MGVPAHSLVVAVVVVTCGCGSGNAASSPTNAPEAKADCASELHFEAGRGCIPNASVAPTAVGPSPAVLPPRAESGAMARIPGGTFQMGSRAGGGEADKHPVTVAGFEMDVTEVTTGAYSACVRAGDCSAAATDNAACNYGKSDKDNYPINCVNWGQATTYCHVQGKRLPTEEEWEYAARGGAEGRTYAWGNAPPDSQVCWSGISKRDGTCAVGNFARGAFGLADMTGNVWEWTASNSSADHGKNSPAPARVIRGGSWDFVVASLLRSSFRPWSAPSDRGNNIGFRCAR